MFQEALPDIISGIVLFVVCTGIPALVALLVRTCRGLRRLGDDMNHRRDENRLLFRGFLALSDAVRTGQSNGTLSAVEKDINLYLRESAIQ